MAVRTYFPHDAFLVELLLQAAQRLVNDSPFLIFYL
jgi:hypothetical protein